jgi:hypothetical protein
LCHEDAQASCCTRDEGRPFAVALEGETANCQKLLQAKAVVVNVLVKRRDDMITSGVEERDERKRTSDEASKTLR